MPRPRTVMHPEDAAEICAKWPELSVLKLSERYGYSKRITERVLTAHYGSLKQARLDQGAWTDPPPPGASRKGVIAKRRKQAQQKFEEAIFRSRLLLPLF